MGMGAVRMCTCYLFYESAGGLAGRQAGWLLVLSLCARVPLMELQVAEPGRRKSG